jgi:hypothetical protein
MDLNNDYEEPIENYSFNSRSVEELISSQSCDCFHVKSDPAHQASAWSVVQA